MNQVGDEAEPCSECGYNIKPHGVHVSWCSQKQKQDKEILRGSVEGTSAGDEAGATCEHGQSGPHGFVVPGAGGIHCPGPQAAHPSPEPSQSKRKCWMAFKNPNLACKDRCFNVQSCGAFNDGLSVIQKPEPPEPQREDLIDAIARAIFAIAPGAEYYPEDEDHFRAFARAAIKAVEEFHRGK